MRLTDYRDALQLLNSALTAVEKRHVMPPAGLRRKLRRLSIELALLRARLKQPAPASMRN